MFAAIASSVALLFGPALENAVAGGVVGRHGRRRPGLEVPRIGLGDRVAVLVHLGLAVLDDTGSVKPWPMIFEPTSLPST